MTDDVSWSPRLGSRLEAFRTRAGMNRVTLAARLQVSEETVRLWERGAVQPSVDHLARLIALLSVEVSFWEAEEPADSNDLPSLAHALRSERLDRSLTQAAVASRMQVAQATYAAWETGRAHPSRQHVGRLAAFLGVAESAVTALCEAPYVVDTSAWPPFGRLVGGRREALGLTRADLADAVGVSARTVMSWELGYRRPQPRQLTRLAAALSVGTDELVDVLPTRLGTSSLGDLILRRQRELGLRSTDLARLVGTTDATISRWVNGHSRPAAKNLERLAEALGLPTSHLADAASQPA